MLKTLNRYFSHYQALRLPACLGAEFLLISGTVFATTLQQFSSSGFTAGQMLPYIARAFFTAFICQICMYYLDLYDFNISWSPRKFFTRIIFSITSSMVILYLIYHVLLKSNFDGKLSFGFLIMPVCLILWRLAFFYLQEKIFKINILIFGTGTEARNLAKEILCRKHLGYEIKGVVDNEYSLNGINVANLHMLGTAEQLQDIVKRESIDKVVVALPDRRGKLPMETLLTCKLQGVDVEEGVTFYEQISGKIALENLRPSWIVFSQDFTTSPLVLLLKRLLDIFLSVTGLVLATPVMLLIPILIKLDSRGPVLYLQTRVGQNGEDFTLVKFRSMRADAEARTGPVFAGEDDDRITRVGQWLRTMRLDELPQLFNVLKGEMSFVGPRPERPFFVESLKKQVPYYIQRLSVKPGITGWAQVNYPYGVTTEDALEKLQLDLYYIKHMSLSLDLLIVLKTLKIAVSGEGAR